jgi:hypothetical protein
MICYISGRYNYHSAVKCETRSFSSITTYMTNLGCYLEASRRQTPNALQLRSVTYNTSSADAFDDDQMRRPM